MCSPALAPLSLFSLSLSLSLGNDNDEDDRLRRGNARKSGEQKPTKEASEETHLPLTAKQNKTKQNNTKQNKTQNTRQLTANQQNKTQTKQNKHKLTHLTTNRQTTNRTTLQRATAREFQPTIDYRLRQVPLKAARDLRVKIATNQIRGVTASGTFQF